MKPLGKLLQQADLVSSEQVEIALQEQTQVAGMRLGEILALHGWLKQETADFFSQQWPMLLEEESKQPLGKYLEEAGLLNKYQIKAILTEQTQQNLRFGELAVQKGWLKPSTIQFFLEHLAPVTQWPNHIWRHTEAPTYESVTQTEEQLHLAMVAPQQNDLKTANQVQQPSLEMNLAQPESSEFKLLSRSAVKIFKLFALDTKAESPKDLLREIILWTDGQPMLTQKLCQLLAESESFLSTGAEAETVKQLIQSNLIDNWETQAAAEHLQKLQSKIIHNQECDPLFLLEVYQQIWEQGELSIDNSPEQVELLHLGLVKQQKDKLKLGNRIYQSVFDRNWVKVELEKMLHPSLAQTAIYDPISSATTINVSKTMAPAESTVSKRLLALLAIAALMICGSGLMVLGFSVFKWLQIETIFKSGNALLHEGQYQQAIAKYDNIVKIDSNYYQSWTNRGYALARLRDYDQMLESCKTATLINPRAVYAWNCQGEALYNLKQYNAAIAAYDQAIILNSEDPAFWINKTEALLAMQQSDKALVSVNQAINLLTKIWQQEPQDANAKELAIAYSYQAKVLLQKTDYENALNAFEQALKYNPKYYVALRGKGIALQNLKRDDQAIAQFYYLLDHHQLTNAQKAESWYYLGLSLCEFRQHDKAIAAFNQALKFKPDYAAAVRAVTACSK
ncbi:tetratricopeptide repeat protein [Nostoc sp. FACHB-110]|uniref:tetratricopeptide repeat protein n=1 Tax=Nostoc sp. FACHB-110 TaxID=2692834 RepID=UPI001681F6A3|nr:tetratricopeptide repeat protein [Nostoc sp. FACHB-110]MBD2436615.1 tetratricopeptide repeat protein [Nostoc sp. FACHB-110]